MQLKFWIRYRIAIKVQSYAVPSKPLFQAMVALACFVSILKKGLQNRKVLRLIGSKNENGLVVETTSDAKAQSLHLLLKWAQDCANVMKTRKLKFF